MTLPTILFLGAGQAAFLVALIARKRPKSLADRILGAWILTLGAHHLLHALLFQGTVLPPALLNLNAGVPLLQGPFLFLYVEALTSGRRRMRALDFLHLLPFLAFAAYVLLLLPRLQSSGRTTLSLFELSGWITLAILVSVPAYALASLVRLRRYETDLLNRHSERHGRDLAWLRRITLALIAVWSVVILATVAPSWLPAGSGHQMMTAVTLFIYAVGYFGWRQFAVVDSTESESGTGAESEIETDHGQESAKYQRSGLREAELQELVARLEAHLTEDKPYLEPGVTLVQIAANLETTPNHLSQAINQGLVKSFHALINERRVEEFKQRVVDPRNRHRNLLAVAFDSGFSSKSSFNRVFKQQVGTSPRQYLRNRDPDL